MKKNGKCALKIQQIVIIFAILLVGGTILQVFNVNSEAQVAECDVQEEVQMAETFEREINLTTRSDTDRTKTIKAAKAVVHYKTIDEVTISKNMDLTERTGLSREDFITLMTRLKQDTSGFFEKNAGLIYDLCEKYELNEIFFCGLMAGESGWNIASGHRSTHNYISMMSGGHLIHFNSDEEGLEAATKLLHTKYLSEGGCFYTGKTLYNVQRVFCPNSSTWVGLIYTCMSQIVK